MNFAVLSRYEIEKYISARKHIVISIHDPESKPPVLPYNPERMAALVLSFHDLEEKVKGYDYVLFDVDHARRILKFIET